MSVKKVHFSLTQPHSAPRRQGRPPRLSAAPWLEHTDHDPVEMLLRMGKGWAATTQLSADMAPRPDVLRFLGCSSEATGLREKYACAVTQELRLLSATHVDWELVADVMRKAAFQVVGAMPRRRVKPWLHGKEVELHTLESAVHCCESALRQARANRDPNVEALLTERRQASQSPRAAKRRGKHVGGMT